MMIFEPIYNLFYNQFFDPIVEALETSNFPMIIEAPLKAINNILGAAVRIFKVDNYIDEFTTQDVSQIIASILTVIVIIWLTKIIINLFKFAFNYINDLEFRKNGTKKKR